MAAKVVLLGLGTGLTNHFVEERVGRFLHADMHLALAAYSAIWAAAFLALLYVAFTPRPGVRAFWAALIGLSTLTGEAYFRVAGDRLTIEALDAMGGAAQLDVVTVAFYGRETAIAALATAVLLAGILVPPPPLRASRSRGLALLPILPCLLVAAVILYAAAGGGHETRGLPSQFHDLALLAVYAASGEPKPDRAEVDIPLVRRMAAEHVVLVVDESVRGDFIDLNVPRGTTPYLATRPEGTVNFGLALAAGNCSTTSNAVLRLGANPERLGRDDYTPLANPSVWKYARRAGFETSYVEAHPLAETSQNLMDPTEIGLIDRVVSVPRDVAVESRDLAVAELLLDVLRRPTPQFVYVNKIGAHFPYDRFTPSDDVRFRPTMQPLEPVADRERLVNSYKNAIHRNVDQFFRALLPRVDWRDTVLLYTSDHGQNLLDDGRPITHCRRTGQTVNEAIVPLLAWTGNKRLRERLERAASVNFGAASHFEVFPTLLVLFGYDPAVVRAQYRQSLFEDIEQPLGWVSGPITGRFGRRPTWNSRAGLDRFRR